MIIPSKLCVCVCVCVVSNLSSTPQGFELQQSGGVSDGRPFARPPQRTVSLMWFSVGMFDFPASC